jgi:hypothetical protein
VSAAGVVVPLTSLLLLASGILAALLEHPFFPARVIVALLAKAFLRLGVVVALVLKELLAPGLVLPLLAHSGLPALVVLSLTTQPFLEAQLFLSIQALTFIDLGILLSKSALTFLHAGIFLSTNPQALLDAQLFLPLEAKAFDHVGVVLSLLAELKLTLTFAGALLVLPENSLPFDEARFLAQPERLPGLLWGALRGCLSHPEQHDCAKESVRHLLGYRLAGPGGFPVRPTRANANSRAWLLGSAGNPSPGNHSARTVSSEGRNSPARIRHR